MIRIADKYKDKNALVIMGGPSIIEKNFNLGLIDKDKYTVFLESKALTPKFLEFGIKPDFFLMFFPEKCQTNSLQHVIYQSFMADINLSKLLKPEHIAEYNHLKDEFNSFFEIWRPHKGAHKKYKWRNHIIMKNSPFDLLSNLPDTAIIARINPEEKCPFVADFNNEMLFYEDRLMEGDFCLNKYYSSTKAEGCLMLNGYGHLNSAAIALFPLLAYMGFRKIYFVGMDMSMLGSMEYSALYTFKSLKHFRKFFKKAIPVFNYHFKENRKKFMRPPYEFRNMKEVINYDKIEFINIYELFEFAKSIDGMRNISFKEFLNEC